MLSDYPTTFAGDVCGLAACENEISRVASHWPQQPDVATQRRADIAYFYANLIDYFRVFMCLWGAATVYYGAARWPARPTQRARAQAATAQRALTRTRNAPQVIRSRRP